MSAHLLDKARLRDAERIVRIVMAVILLTAGTSKFFSGGGFFDYYSSLFQGDLRVSMPPVIIDAYLAVIPFIEVLLGMALLWTRLRLPAIYAWFVFMVSLLIGHYILEEWSAVNQMLDYIFLGLLALVLPPHESLIGRNRTGH